MTAARCPLSVPQGMWVTSMAQALIGAGSGGDAALGSRSWSAEAFVAEPLLGAKDAVDGLLVDQESVPEAKESPQPPISTGGMLFDELPDTLHQEGSERPASGRRSGKDVLSGHSRSRYFKHPADAAHGHL